MWGYFSKDPTKDFAYETSDQIGDLYLADKTVWTLYKGKHKTTGEEVSVFSCDTKTGASTTQLEVAKGAIKRLKTLKHPSVLTYIDSIETDQLVLLATEPVEPAILHLETLSETGPKREYYEAWGIFQVCRALSFLNNDAKLRHNNIHGGSVFVNRSGEWKLAGLEYVCGSDNAEPPVKVSPQLAKYDPPEKKDLSMQRNATVWSADVWGLGVLIWEVYNGPLKTMENLGKFGNIPKKLIPTYKSCVGSNPGKRPNPLELVSKLRRSPEFFKNDLIDALLFLEEVQIKEDSDKSRFFSSLTPLLENFPTNVLNNKILPQLINAFEYGNAGSAILGPVFKIGKNLETADYQKRIVPCIVKLFSSNDRNARFKLLSQVEYFVEHLSKDIVNNQVFPKIESGFLDSEPIIREKTVISMIHLAPKLSYANLDEIVVLKHFSRISRDEQGGIRTNTTVCLGKIARFLHPKTRQQVLLPAFARTLKDPFPPSRLAGLNAITATQQYYTVQETGTRVLPILCAATVDPEKDVRDQALKVIKGFLGKLEKVSEDPSLKEEMEKDVGSTNSALVTAASSWAGWAAGAVTAKFFKSSSPPVVKSTGETETPKKDTSGNTEDEVQKSPKDIPKSPKDNQKVNSLRAKVTPDKEEIKMEATNDANSGWDDCDNWEAEGADDDWGSLEETKTAKNSTDSAGDAWASPTSAANDGWGPSSPEKNDSFSFGDASETRSRGTQDKTIKADADGWDDWEGCSEVKGLSINDDSKKKRDDKKKERQKEIEAKRAARAKGGPLKLGAKKMMD